MTGEHEMFQVVTVRSREGKPDLETIAFWSFDLEVSLEIYKEKWAEFEESKTTHVELRRVIH